MKHIFPFILIGISLYIYSCANQGTPTGGPKDTIPPTLITSVPLPQSTNYKSQEFSFVFSEKIDASKIKRELLITPLTETKYEVKIKKQLLTIKFEEPFEDNTTYTLNFGDGVVDITEKNPVKNFSLAFSTGTIIDSIYITGKITDLYTNKAQDECVVALYQISDSLDLFKDKPRYFAKSNKSGQFIIRNIKSGHYKLLAFDDENKNLLLNPDTESHGFKAGAIDLTTSIDSIPLPIQLINATKFKFVRAKAKGPYYEIQYNKGVIQYEINKIDTVSQLDIPENNRSKQTIIFYPNEKIRMDVDSLQLSITALDSMDNQTIDTVFLKFVTSKRKKKNMSQTISPKNKTFINPALTHTIRFTKPIDTFSKDSIVFTYDTLGRVGIIDSTIQWNASRTVITFETQLNKTYLQTKIDSLLEILSDTTITDSVSLAQKTYYHKVKTKDVSLTIPKATFISIENDSSEIIQHLYRFNTQDETGSVSGTINTTYTSYVVQLIDKYDNVVESQQNVTNFQFPYVKPGDYTIRIMIDENADGIWSYGNILQDRPPEPIYFYPEPFTVRANWTLENIKITF